ncbi:MAG: ATP-dependent DNA helicase [Lautropia sp.]
MSLLRRTTADAFADDGALAAGSPGYRRREAQARLADLIAAAIDEAGCLVAEAGTGIGKTFAYLVPALLAGRRVLVSTGTRQLQDQLFERDVVAVRRALGVDLQAAVLKGRANYVCPLHLKRNLSDGRFRDPATPAKLRVIERFAAIDPTADRAGCTGLSEDDPVWALATSTRDNCLGQECPELRQCPLMKARVRAQRADLLIVNHHLFCADLALKDDAIGDFLPKAEILVFDEAHQLPATATEFFGEALSTRQLIDLGRDALRAALGGDAPGAAAAADWRALYQALESAAKRLRLALPEGVQRLGVDELRTLPPGPDGDLAEAIAAVTAALGQLGAALDAQAERSIDLLRCGQRAGELAARAARWLAATGSAASAADPVIVWAQTTANHAVLRATPLAIADRFAGQRAVQGGAWVFVSATLAVDGTLAQFAETVGMSEAVQAVLPSPFDYPAQAGIWVADQVGAPSAPVFSERVADRIWPLIDGNRGRAFVLCTTLRAVRVISERLKTLAGGAPVAVLTQGDAPRHELLQRFRAKPAAVLVGAAGFWEGVDVVGDGLSLVVIDKLPFAPPDDPVLRARGRAIEAGGGNAFAELSLPAAAMALKQGAGRLIRSETDRGLLVICDERLATRRYGARLFASMPPFRRVRSLDEALACLPDAAQPPCLSPTGS